jgi:hypothetical protein
MNTHGKRPAAPAQNMTADREIIRAGWRAMDKFLRDGNEETASNRVPRKAQTNVVA